jgi:predicted AAA+ superfamily ATPase
MTLKDVQLWLNRGGLPGIFSVREESNREALFESWVETTCTRDLAQFGIARFHPELARRILTAVARVEIPNRTEIARAVGKTPRQIESYLQALKSLFVLYEVEPSVTSKGKPFFHLFDSGIAAALGANAHRRLQTWFLNECGSQFSCAGLARPNIFHYETTRGSRIDFIVEAKSTRYAIKLSHEEMPSTYTLRAAEAFRAKHSDIPVYLLAPCLSVHKVEPGLTILPWTAIAT